MHCCGWCSVVDVPRMFPCWRYASGGRAVLLATYADWEALEGEWYDSPAKVPPEPVLAPEPVEAEAPPAAKPPPKRPRTRARKP